VKALTKTARRKGARSVRAALQQYLIWLEPFMAEGRTPGQVSAQQMGWLLAARDRLNDLIKAELDARAAAQGEETRR